MWSKKILRINSSQNYFSQNSMESPIIMAPQFVVVASRVTQMWGVETTAITNGNQASKRVFATESGLDV